jgi:hypothetical protein
MLGLFNLEFINLNSQRRYPLADDVTTQDVTLSFTLPNSFILEIDLPVSSGVSVDPSQFFLQQLGVYGSGFVVVIGYQPAVGAPVSVAIAQISRATHVPNNVYTLNGTGNFADTQGKIVIGDLSDIDLQPAGIFNFAVTDTRLDSDAIRLMLRELTGLVVVSGGQSSQRVYGDVEFVADQNFQFSVVNTVGQNPQIHFSAISGEGTITPCICVDDQTAPPIRTINGISGTPGGDFFLLGGDCVNFTAMANGLTLNDTCSQPCCGCSELQVINQALQLFGSEKTTLANFLSQLAAEVSTMSLTVLGSRIADTGCSQQGG